MAVRSMTGFGRAEAGSDTLSVTVEARSVNHRHLDIAIRLPRALAGHEGDARRLVQGRLERGRVDISVQVGVAPGVAARRVRTDTALALEYVARARELGRAAGISGDVTLPWLLERPGVLFSSEDAEGAADQAAWPLVVEALGRALDELAERRTAEGAALAGELGGLLAELRAVGDVLAARAPAGATRREERLRERLRTLLDGTLDEGRIVAEAAVWAEKTDIQEELARLKAHVDQFARLLDKGGPLGRSLDFLLQELHREVNTIGAKADDLELSQTVLAAKGIVERMREQVQNLE